MKYLSIIGSLCFTAVTSSPFPDQGLPVRSRAAGKSAPAIPGNATFDYVIVGGGTAGLAIASRLAENPSLSVAVVEAGGFYEVDNGNLSTTPGYATAFIGTDPSLTNPAVDWGFVTVPQAGADHRRLHYARGRTLGGSSALNFMLYHRQTVGSAQKWATETGDPSYTFPNLLPFYEKSVHYTSPQIPYTNSTFMDDLSVFESSGGPLQVSTGRYHDPFAAQVQQALLETGQSPIPGFSSGKLLGSTYVPLTINPINSTRSSSEASFLQAALKTTTIKVYNNTMAQKILLKGDTAIGVSVSSRTTNQTYILSARKEVILSAGAFQSPQLLMVSGIGPRPILEPLKIPVVKELPGVGQNLWDHLFFGTSFRVDMPTASAGLNNPALTAAAVEAYQKSAAGPLSIPGSNMISFEKLPPAYRNKLTPSTLAALNATFPSDWPEIEYIPASALFANQSNYYTLDPVDGYNYATIASALVSPLSRGNISITSPSMSDPPLINPNYLSHPADRELAIAAFKRTRDIWRTLSDLTLGEEYYPGAAVRTDEQILKAVEDSLAPVWHPAATCKMGKMGDRMAVVDSETKVIGMKGLRVVDASAFPFLPPGHPQATVYALAEKIADLILRGLKS